MNDSIRRLIPAVIAVTALASGVLGQQQAAPAADLAALEPGLGELRDAVASPGAWGMGSLSYIKAPRVPAHARTPARRFRGRSFPRRASYGKKLDILAATRSDVPQAARLPGRPGHRRSNGLVPPPEAEAEAGARSLEVLCGAIGSIQTAFGDASRALKGLLWRVSL